MKRNILFSALVSTILLSTSLLSEGMNCTTTHCKIDLSKLTTSRDAVTPVTKATIRIEKSNQEFIILAPSKYIAQSGETLESDEDRNIILFTHEIYIAKANEPLDYIEESSILEGNSITTEEKIIKKALPSSTYYCKNDKQKTSNQECA